MNEPDVWFERWANEMCLGETDWCLQNVWFCLLLFWNSNLRFKSMIRKYVKLFSPVSRLWIKREAGVTLLQSPTTTRGRTDQYHSMETGKWRLARFLGWLLLWGCYRGYQPTINTDPTLPRLGMSVSVSNQIIKMSISQVWIPYVYTHKAHPGLATQVNVPAISSVWQTCIPDVLESRSSTSLHTRNIWNNIPITASHS